jgi:hypothetical protein
MAGLDSRAEDTFMNTFSRWRCRAGTNRPRPDYFSRSILLWPVPAADLQHLHDSGDRMAAAAAGWAFSTTFSLERVARGSFAAIRWGGNV